MFEFGDVGEVERVFHSMVNWFMEKTLLKICILFASPKKKIDLVVRIFSLFSCKHSVGNVLLLSMLTFCSRNQIYCRTL